MTVALRNRTGRKSSWRRRAVVVVLGYAAVTITWVVASEIVVVGSRLVGGDLRSELDGVPNFRVVDDRVMAGGQPAAADVYPKLADLGVVLIVDVRTGAGDDPNEDDPDALRALGIDYLSLPVSDGHVPSDRDVERFVTAVREARGLVFVHCGAGVGRTSSMTAAYLRESGAEPPVVDQLALGSHTLEQMWFVTTGDSNVVVRRLSEAIDAPRRAWSRIRSAF
jgi:protein tyrosine phosphatase (PTP) superfamily phosphohydrolase (DUF442 family)